MTRYVVDTNVPVVANGPRPGDSRPPSTGCRIAAVTFLRDLLASGRMLIDRGGAIQAEYHRHLNPSGQPGVGDRFYLELLNSAPHRVERIDLPKREDGEYADLPRALVAAGFDPADRKFAALAKREGVPVANAIDGDWLDHRATLAENGIDVTFLCGCDRTAWFAD